LSDSPFTASASFVGSSVGSSIALPAGNSVTGYTWVETAPFSPYTCSVIAFLSIADRSAVRSAWSLNRPLFSLTNTSDLKNAGKRCTCSFGSFDSESMSESERPWMIMLSSPLSSFNRAVEMSGMIEMLIADTAGFAPQ
jgi:hypothetical protein